jgi:hypothetical protein
MVESWVDSCVKYWGLLKIEHIVPLDFICTVRSMIDRVSRYMGLIFM